MPAPAPVALDWIDAGGGYAVAFRGAQIVARSPRGTLLKSVPAALREAPPVQQLRALRDWLERHERECAATVEMWMVRSLPVPTRVLAAVWSDPAWQQPLHDAVTIPLDAAGQPLREQAGFLRHVEAARGVGLITLDGETLWSTARCVVLPHPVNLPELADFRDFATELQVEQAIPQLYRETWPKSAELDPAATLVTDFSQGYFAQLMQATGRAGALGYQVSGGLAVTRIWEAGRLVEARYWIGDGGPMEPTWTGDLMWVDSASRPLSLGQLGPVAYSEGMRMAAAISAGRSIEEGGAR
jgi:hypothetical protein